ncbi:Endonuclease III [Candidatus Calditenuaceae archaeon HR02]|nr:Endonuclease III [Candidatus Calditenuaceae archaeon HR02]
MTIGEEILRRLRTQYRIQAEEYVSLYTHLQSRDPFRVLVATILSQNTTDKAALNALKTLERDVGLTPPAILEAGKRRVEKAIHIAGMYRSKARFILEVSRIVMERYGGDMWNVLKGDAEGVRERLMSMPGVGGKTADVLLATLGIARTVPVDTHVRRVSARLGLVDEGASYETIRKRLEEVFSPDSRHLAHLLLIAHGRNVCRARKPMCRECVLNDLCKYYREIRKNQL